MKACDARDGLYSGNRLALQVQVNGGVAGCGARAGLPQPLPDGGKIHSCLQESHRSAVTHTVRVQALARECDDVGAGMFQMFRQNVSNSEPSQRCPTMVQKYSCFGWQVD